MYRIKFLIWILALGGSKWILFLVFCINNLTAVMQSESEVPFYVYKFLTKEWVVRKITLISWYRAIQRQLLLSFTNALVLGKRPVQNIIEFIQNKLLCSVWTVLESLSSIISSFKKTYLNEQHFLLLY